MPGNQIHFEETHSITVDITTLLRFFARYFTSYKKMILVSLLLAFCVIVTDLLFPQLLRLVIDRHLTSAARKISLKDVPAGSAEFITAQTQYIIPCAEDECYFILPEGLKNLQDVEIKQLEQDGVMLPDKYYAVRVGPDIADIITKHAGLFYQSGDFVFTQYSNLSKLTTIELKRLRAGDLQGITQITFLALAVLALSFIFNFSQVYIVEYTSQKIMHDIRTGIFTHIQNQCLSFFTKTPVGRLVTRATNDVQNLHEMFNALFASILKDFFILLGILVVLFWTNWQLSLICFVVLPFLVICTAVFSVQSRNAFREVRIKIAAINTKVQENIAGLAVVKSFCREKLNEMRFQQLNHENYLANMKQIIIFAIFNPLVDLTRMSAIALVIWYGGGKTVQEAITLGTLVVFLYYIRMFFRPIQDLAEKYNIIQSAFASLERIYLLLTDSSIIADPSRPKSSNTDRLDGKIEFRNVTFGYIDGENVLENVSFSINAGETVAIVGLTGAGKTTVINLLERFYDVQHGSILIDGIDIRDIEKSFLRSHIGLVMQDVFLFGGSLQGNITLGNNQFSRKEIETALEVANASALVKKLPDGLNEDVKEGGKILSTGERQLLSFARAVLINPRILILDEATSNIDPLTERLIQDALEKLLKDRTSLIIAHRFSTIQKADRIIVLHKGRIHELGTPAELMKKEGMYYKLCKLQYLG